MYHPRVGRESVIPEWKDFAYSYAPYQGMGDAKTALAVGGVALVGGVVALAYWQDYNQKKADAEAANAKAQEVLGAAIAKGAQAQAQQAKAQAMIDSGDPSQVAKGQAILAQAQADYGAAQQAQGQAIALKAQAAYKAQQAQQAAQAITAQAAVKGVSLTPQQIDAAASSMGMSKWVWIIAAALIGVGGVVYFTRKQPKRRRRV